MTTIRTSCSLCGDIELVPADLSLELAASDGTGSYLFECPHCDDTQRRPANHRVVSILLATGVAYHVVDDVGGPITEGEISHFAAELDRDDWYQQLKRWRISESRLRDGLRVVPQHVLRGGVPCRSVQCQPRRTGDDCGGCPRALQPASPARARQKGWSVGTGAPRRRSGSAKRSRSRVRRDPEAAGRRPPEREIGAGRCCRCRFIADGCQHRRGCSPPEHSRSGLE